MESIGNEFRKKYESLKNKAKEARIIVVTKTLDVQQLKILATDSTLYEIGESRWQDFERRFIKTNLFEEFRKKGVIFHFIGPLQTNKVNKVVKYFDSIQSIDSMKLLEKVNVESFKQNKITSVLIEVNVTNDIRKHGMKIEEFEDIYDKAEALTSVKVDGLMTMIDKDHEKKDVIQGFKKTKALAKSRNLSIVSMGTSEDYNLAIAAGSTMIRIGSMLFKHNYGKYGRTC